MYFRTAVSKCFELPTTTHEAPGYETAELLRGKVICRHYRYNVNNSGAVAGLVSAYSSCLAVLACSMC